MKRTLKKYRDPVLWPLLENFFTPNSDFFPLNTLKDTAKASDVDPLKLNTLRGTKPTFLTPKRSFLYGSLGTYASQCIMC